MHSDNPEFWQEKYSDNDIPWNTKTITPALIQAIDHLNSKKIAILGCGYSEDSIFLADKGHLVYSVDFAAKPIEYLNRMKSKKKADTLFPVQEDIFKLSERYSNFFDIVLEYTCFCAITPKRRTQYIKTVHSILNKKGKFIALFFPTKIRQEGRHKGPPFFVDLNDTLSMFKDKFHIIESNKNPNSIKPRKGFETLVVMAKK